METRIVDLRSDTVTKPTAAMRRAIAEAEVGDDVFQEDITVQRLERRCAQLAGKEAALFVPSGTMANLIACKVHTQPGDELITERTSHVYRYEAGGYAAFAGVSVALLDAPRGILRPEQIPGALRAPDVHQPVTRLLWLENTHNYGGGSCYPPDQLAAVCVAGRERGLAIHMDGARVWNACVAQGLHLEEIARHVDTVNFCFSKGLGCPVGSVFIGSRDHVEAAQRVRKMIGGGMRQVGVLAAAALHALDHHIDRLAEDHANAQYLAEGLDGCAGLQVKDGRVETNIVFFDTRACPRSAVELFGEFAAVGVRCLPMTEDTLRMVTHLDVTREDVEMAVERCRTVLLAGV